MYMTNLCIQLCLQKYPHSRCRKTDKVSSYTLPTPPAPNSKSKFQSLLKGAGANAGQCASMKNQEPRGAGSEVIQAVSGKGVRGKRRV